MEYGYEIIDTAGNKTFFVGGCTCCQMSTGGLHENDCPYKKDEAGYTKWAPLIEPPPQATTAPSEGLKGK